MEQHPSGDAEPLNPASGLDAGPAASADGSAELLPGSLGTSELEAEAAEIRRLIDEGADSPEAVRELAARLRTHREREEAQWRAEVRPVLKQEGKGRLFSRPAPSIVVSASPAATDQSPDQIAADHTRTLLIGALVLGLVLVVLLAVSPPLWLVLLPVAGFLGWAWKQGKAIPPDA